MRNASLHRTHRGGKSREEKGRVSLHFQVCISPFLNYLWGIEISSFRLFWLICFVTKVGLFTPYILGIYEYTKGARPWYKPGTYLAADRPANHLNKPHPDLATSHLLSYATPYHLATRHPVMCLPIPNHLSTRHPVMWLPHTQSLSYATPNHVTSPYPIT